jgi:prepilin-type N-terminal cleavage/methylation domain-containing protein
MTNVESQMMKECRKPNNERTSNDQMTNEWSTTIRASSFGFVSSFGFRHSSLSPPHGITAPRRRGFTLVELLTAATVGSALMGIAVGLLYALMRADAGVHEQSAHRLAAARLADQFRRDAHAARRLVQGERGKAQEARGKAEGGRGNGGGTYPPSASPLPPSALSTTWRFELADGREVEYRPAPERLLRVERWHGRTVREEQFVLQPGWRASVDRPAVWPGVVRLIVAPPGSPQQPRTDTQIDAQLGKDLRYRGQGTGKM